MARQRFSPSVLVVILLAVGHSKAITSKGGGFQTLEPDRVTSERVDQQTNGQWQQQVHGQEQWHGQHTQDSAQWPGQQTQGPAQWPWPGQQTQGPAQWPDQQTQGPAQWPGQQTQGSGQWPGQLTQGPAQWPGEQTQEPEQWPEQPTRGPAQWSEQQTQRPAQWPEQQTQGPALWPEQPQSPAQWPGQQTQGPAQWPAQQTQDPAQQTQGPVEWPEQPFGQQGTGEWNNLEQMQGHEQELEQGSQIVSERPVQEEKGGQIEHQKQEYPSKGVTQTEYWTQTSWTWETNKGNQRPSGDPKHPVVLPPVPMQSPSDLERVLTDEQLVWPVTVLVDTDPESLQHTQKQWMAVDEGTLQDNQFDLITFNDTRASPARRVHGVPGLRRALAALGGSSASARGAAFLAMLTASQSAPRQRSAMLLFTGRPSADENYGALASQELVNRGCRLFVWWSGARRYGSSSGAERLYRDAVQHTGGTFYDGDQRPHPAPYEQHMQVILAAREGLHGSVRTDVLVDSTVEELTIIILGYVSKASLRPPSGDVIDLLLLHGDARPVAVGEGETAAGGVLERRLNTRGEQPGRWQLTTSDGSGSTGADADADAGAANPDDGYDVIVKGTSGLRIGLQRPGHPVADGATLVNNDDLIVTIHGGPRTNITGLVLLDNRGNELRQTYYKQRTRRDEHNREVIELSLTQKALEMEKQLMPHYVQVNGYNGYNGGAGEAFTRITPQIPTSGSLIVSLNAASNLTIQPGTQSQVFLDITNNGSRPSRISVQGGSSRNILYRVTPNNFQLYPNQKRLVSLHLYAPQNLVGVGDTLKIQIFGDLTVSELFLEINIADIIHETRDTDRPSLKHKILNDCREIKSCSSRQWTMEATVQDQDSGIREISSMPQGVIWTPMIIGTKLPTTLKYKASCCEESVVITVIDLQKNVARYTVNVNEESTGLSPGVIAGIVVGALVILIIIIVIIVVVCKKNKTTHTFQTQQVAR